MRAVREPFEHAYRVEIPHGRPRHNVEPQRTKNRKIYGSVDLFHKAILLCVRPDLKAHCQGADEALHEQLTREREHDDVECHKGEVGGTFAIVLRGGRVETEGKRD